MDIEMCDFSIIMKNSPLWNVADRPDHIGPWAAAHAFEGNSFQISSTNLRRKLNGFFFSRKNLQICTFIKLITNVVGQK